jgi:hypothetical protein
MEVTQIHSLIGEQLVEFAHRWLVFRTDGSQDDLVAIFHRPARNVLERIRSYGGPRQSPIMNLRIGKNDPGV